MKFKKILHFLALVVFFGAVNFLHAAANATGTVTDAITGLPIQGALVTLIRGNQVRGSDTTNGSGQYLITGVKAGNYSIVVVASGYQAQEVGANLDNNATTVTNFSLTPNGGTISGKVTDANTTNPISGATMKLFQGDTFIEATTTDGSGNYSFSNLALGSYRVVAMAPGYGDQAEGAIIVSAGAVTTANFALNTLQGSLAGTVTDALTTNPIAGATITVMSGSTVIASVDTDVAGVYTIANLTPGDYEVIASEDGYQTQIKEATVANGTATTVNFALVLNPGTIAGTVTRSDTGAPIRGAQVALFKGLEFIASTLTAPDGTYNFSNLAPGNYIVVCTAANFQTQDQDATVVSNATTTVNFALDPSPGTIAGRVTDAVTTNPIAGASITVVDGPLVIATSLTDANGNYIISTIAPGNYSVIARASGYQSHMTAATVTANNTTTVNFALNTLPGTIAGTVTDALTTNPIAGAAIEIFQGTTLIAFTMTDANGAYSIPGLAPGTYTVVADASGYQAHETSASVTANTTTVVNFALANDPGTITGMVTDQCSGAAVSGALIIVLDGNAIISFGVTDPSGQYTIPDLAPGTYTLLISKNKYVTTSSTATVTAGNTTTANVIITPVPLAAGAISGRAFFDTFLTQKERVHRITWTASPSGCIVGYHIFRNGSFIATVSASGALVFSDHNRNSGTDTYSVRAVNAFGQVSDFVTTTLS